MRAAAAAGGRADQRRGRALRADGALAAAAASGLPVCLMHMCGEPGDMQDAPRYDDVAAEGRGVPRRAPRRAALAAGIRPDRVLVDPGFGFGKTLDHNLALLRARSSASGRSPPVLAGDLQEGHDRRADRELPRGRTPGTADAGGAGGRGARTPGGDGCPAGAPLDVRTSSPIRPPSACTAPVAAALLAVQRGAAIVRVHDVAPTVRALAVLEGIEGPRRASPVAAVR